MNPLLARLSRIAIAPGLAVLLAACGGGGGGDGDDDGNTPPPAHAEIRISPGCPAKIQRAARMHPASGAEHASGSQ